MTAVVESDRYGEGRGELGGSGVTLSSLDGGAAMGDRVLGVLERVNKLAATSSFVVS